MADVNSVRRRHEERLLSLPHVVGVGTGRDETTGNEVIDVYVQRKVSPRELSADEVIPPTVEGVPVRVVPLGEITAQD